jgi:hypothetical protein
MCQDVMDAPSSGGDSGGPVVHWGFGNDVSLYGMMWGSSDGQIGFSALQNIEYDLGGLDVVIASGDEPPPPAECEDPTVLVC